MNPQLAQRSRLFPAGGRAVVDLQHLLSVFVNVVSTLLLTDIALYGWSDGIKKHFKK